MDGIEFEHVFVNYANNSKDFTTVVDDVTANFENGKINVLIGYSGCGKTTLFNCLIGSIVYEGTIKINGVDIEKLSVKERKLSYVSQCFALYPSMTVYDNIAFALKNKKMDRDDCDKKVLEIAKQLDIYYLLTRKPKQISIGQAQRVAIARALVKESDIMLFDEPLSNLDKDTSDVIRRLIKNVATEKKITMIYATHNLDDVMLLADNVFVMNEGKIIGKYSVQGLLNSKDPAVIALLKEYKENHEKN